MINNVGDVEHTNSLFLKPDTLKFRDVVEFEPTQIMYKARLNLLPGNIQNMFMERQGRDHLRGELAYKSVRWFCGMVWSRS